MVTAKPEAPNGHLPVDCLAPTIFHQPWWLDLATGGRWSAVEVEQGGRTVGRMVHIPAGRGPFSVSRMPTLTHFLGPGVDEGTGSVNSRFLQRLSVTRALIAKLPSAASFQQKMHRGVTETLAFQIDGFTTIGQFTHELEPAAEKALWSGLRDKTRNVIRRAQEAVTLCRLDDPAELIRFYGDNLEGRARRSIIDLPRAQLVISGALERAAASVFAARDPDGALAGAIVIVRDDTSAYYLLSTRSREAHNGVVSLLLWEAIRDTAARELLFDFDGIPDAGAVLFLAGFGATVRPRFTVERSRKLFGAVRGTRRLFSHPGLGFG